MTPVQRAARAQARLLCAQGWTAAECDAFVAARWRDYIAFARAAIASCGPIDAVIDRLVEDALSVLHHDADRDSHECQYNVALLRLKFEESLATLAEGDAAEAGG